MASLTYTSFYYDLARGAIDADTDSFKIMLVTSSYTPSKSGHTKRSDVTNEVAAGGGYATGGIAIACTVAIDTVNHRVTFTFANVNWPTATILAAAAVIYKSRGGASSADELVAYVDFGGNIISTADTFSVTLTSPITIQN